PSGVAPVLVGSVLADRIQIFPGDTLILISMENLRPDLMGGLTPTLRQFQVTGTFTTGMYDYDSKNLYTTLESAQDLLGLQPDVAGGIGVRTADPDQVGPVGDALTQRLGFPFYVETWKTTNSALFSALKLEK